MHIHPDSVIIRVRNRIRDAAAEGTSQSQDRLREPGRGAQADDQGRGGRRQRAAGDAFLGYTPAGIGDGDFTGRGTHGVQCRNQYHPRVWREPQEAK